ncbi:hypothetical protein AX16_008418 [Volvariella volvacea WC 439]|nr:hypothetical protein AX16_008418 [Volvariella volvacea WC 439]
MNSRFQLLDSLPTEIVHAIAALTEHKMTLLSMRSTAHRYNAIFSPFVLQTFKITISTSNWSFDPAPDAFVKHTSILKIQLADISIPPTNPIMSHFWAELARFSGVKRLELSWVGISDLDGEGKENHCVSLLDKIFGMILHNTDGHLESLALTRTAPGRDALRTFPDTLMRIRGLQALSLYIGCEWLTAEGCLASQFLPAQVRQLLQNNPLIKRFFLVNLCSNHPLSIQDVFQQSGIEELTIYGPLAPLQLNPIPLNPLTLKTLREIRLYPHGRGPAPSSADMLWDTLRTSNTPLESIHTGDLSPSLFRYLSSTGGLRSLSLELHYLPDKVNLITLSMILLSLSFQAPSLKYFAVFTSKALPDGWEDLGISPSTWRDLPTFPLLESIYIPVSRDLPFSADGCQYLLDFLATFPRLQVATVKWLVLPPQPPLLNPSQGGNDDGDDSDDDQQQPAVAGPGPSSGAADPDAGNGSQDVPAGVFDGFGESFETLTGRPALFTAIYARTTKRFTITRRR